MALIPRITPVNPGGAVDFSPVSNAISENRLMNFKQKQFDANQAHRSETMDMRRQEFDASQRNGSVKRAAGLAQMILRNPDQQSAAQQWQSLLSSNPQYQEGVRELGLDPADYRSGAQALIAEARGFVDPLERQTDEARLGLIQAQTDKARRGPNVDPLARQLNEAKLKKLQQGNAMDQMINGMLSGSQGSQGQPQQQPQPQIQNQSFNGTPQPHAGVQLTADGAPQSQGQQPQPTEQMVQTPVGPMPASKARQLGLAMALRGKGDAGRMFTDPINSQQLGKAATNENDKQQFNSINALARLDEITDLSDERFLTIDNKLKNYGISWLDSIGPLRHLVSTEDRKELKEFTKFRRSAFDNINRYIKEITGAQMSEAEANRLRKAAPDPQKDGPTEFMAKLSDVKKTTRLAIIRFSYLRKNGFKGSAEQAASQMPLTSMGHIVKEIRKKALQKINSQNPDMPEDQKNDLTRQLMRQELGVLS